MCDRPIPQQNLCADLADLVSILPTPLDDECAAVIPFLRAFWATLSREWTSIDVLRMEKYLLLVRRVFGSSLAWATNKKKGSNGKRWDNSRVDGMLKLLQEWPLEKTGDLSKVPVGLRLHVLDIWVDEAEKVELLAELEDEKTFEDSVVLLDGLRRIVEVQARSTCKPVRARAKESLSDERLPWNAAGSSDEDITNEERDAQDGWGGFDD